MATRIPKKNAKNVPSTTLVPPTPSNEPSIPITLSSSPQRVQESTRDDKLAKDIEYCWMLDCTEAEILLYCQLSRYEYHKFLETYPMLADKEKTLRSHPEFLARQNVVDAIKAGDMDMSKWYLERKVPEEFLKPQKVDTTISQNNAPLSVEERQQAISEYLQSLLPADAYTDSSDEE